MRLFSPFLRSLARSRRRGITLIELLSTVVIITILASLGLAGLNRLNTTSRSLKCTSNLRQIGLTINAYVADHNGDVPSSTVKNNASGTYWTEWLWPYVYPSRPWINYGGSELPAPLAGTIFECPEAKNDKNVVNYRSYGFNHHVGDNASATFDKLLAIPNPSSTCLVTDVKDGSQAYANTLMPRHADLLNVLYADGHVAPAEVTPAMLNTTYTNIFWGRNLSQ